jgi:hypothetical protein
LKRLNNMKLISELPKHHTEIYVLGTGRSLDFIRKDFWLDKITIGINWAHRFFPVKYGIVNHTDQLQEIIDKGIIAVTPEYDMGLYTRPRAKMTGEYYMFRHVHNTLYDYTDKHTGYLGIDMSDFDNPETLVVGGTTTSAIHLAYKLGASTIFVCGVDGGSLDGEMNTRGYQVGTQAEHIAEMQPQIDLQ